MECSDESLDLSGDIGAVGRVVISEMGNGSHEMLLDLKGCFYSMTLSLYHLSILYLVKWWNR